MTIDYDNLLFLLRNPWTYISNKENVKGISPEVGTEAADAIEHLRNTLQHLQKKELENG